MKYFTRNFERIGTSTDTTLEEVIAEHGNGWVEEAVDWSSVLAAKLEEVEFHCRTAELKAIRGTALTSEEEAMLDYCIALREVIIPADGSEPIWPTQPGGNS